MKNLGEDLKKIYESERIMLILMIVNTLAALALFITGVVNLNPNSAVVKVGYGDIGGYRDGTWVEMFAFPLFALIFGILHNFIALKIYHKRGAGMTKFFLIATAFLIVVGTFIVLIRLLNEG